MSVLSLDRVAEITNEETLAAGGAIRDRIQDASRMFLRTRLRHREAARLDDEIEGGVALKMIRSQVWVRPYTFRLVCENGAILPAVDEADCIDLTLLPGDVQEESLRESIRDAGKEAPFRNFMRGIHDMQDPMVMTLMLRYLSQFAPDLVLDILSRTREEGDLTAYGIFNGITSLARDSSDPVERWRIEEIGGGIPAWLEQAQTDLEREDALDLPYTDSSLIPA
jgi:hypothetical protein